MQWKQGILFPQQDLISLKAIETKSSCLKKFEKHGKITNLDQSLIEWYMVHCAYQKELRINKFREMLTKTLRVLVNNLFKESFYEKKKK